MFKRKCAQNPLCQVCGSMTESVEHLLLSCEWVKIAWFNYSLTLKPDERNITSFPRWLLEMCGEVNSTNDCVKSYIVTMCWNIWKERCFFVYGRKEADPIMMGNIACAATYEFWDALENISGMPTNLMLIVCRCGHVLLLTTLKLTVMVLFTGWRKRLG